MKSKRIITTLMVAIMCSSPIIANAKTISFSDIKGHWAEKQIISFAEKGYINGYDDNTFNPNGEITRAEFVTIFNKVFNLTKGSNKVFEDTKTHWAKNAIDIAVTNGVCGGKSATNFAPNDKITRQEASKMLSNYLNLSDPNVDKLIAYKDYNEVASWAIKDVEGVIEKGYMKGYPSGEFNPLGTITRAETVSMLNNVLLDQEDAISFNEFSNVLPSLGFDSNGAYWENGQLMGMAYADNDGVGFALQQNSASFNSVIKNCLNMLLPTGGNKVYSIVSNPFSNQTLNLDGRRVVLTQFPQGVSIEIYNN